jgi:hypothetical protein
MWFKKLTIPVFVFFVAVFCSTCQKAYVITGLNGVAQGGLTDSLGNCLPSASVGTFYDGVTPGTDTAFILVNVKVTQPGNYTITSSNQDGFYFTSSGYFTNAGLNTIKLLPVGTPASIGSYTFSMAFDSSTCFFNLAVKDSTGTGLGKPGASTSSGSWQFSAAAGDTTRGANGAGLLVAASGINSLGISGTNAAGDTAINISLSLSSSTIPASGQYSCAAGTAGYQKRRNHLFGYKSGRCNAGG